MNELVEERAAAPILEGLRATTSHLSADEVYEVCLRGGEQELNDLLRHAVNRIIRADGWLMQREQTRPGVSRADLVITELGSGMVFAVVESKMRYATDAVESTEYVTAAIEGDVRKLAAMPPGMPKFFLMWSPYFKVAHRRLRWMRGHDHHEDRWLPRVGLDDCRSAMAELVGRASGSPPKMVPVHDGVGADGDLVLDAWLTAV